MFKSFTLDIKENIRNYAKIIFNINKIRNTYKIYESYGIPEDETIVAYVKSSVLLYPLSMDGNIITDKAFYYHPSHDGWGESNRLPFSELCRYVILQANDTAEVKMVSSDETRIIRGSTVFGKNIAGTEILQFLSDLQNCFVNKYAWAKEQRFLEFDKIVLLARHAMRVGNTPKILDNVLDNIKQNKSFNFKVKLLEAERIFRTCDSKAFSKFINDISNSDVKEFVCKSVDTYTKSFTEDLSDTKLDINLEYLQTVYNNLMYQTNLTSEQILIFAYVSIRIRSYGDDIKSKVRQVYDEGMLRKLDFFKGCYYNEQMAKVYKSIEKNEMPIRECATWKDSIGLTPLHYAIILKKSKIIEELLIRDFWEIKSPFDENDEAAIIYDYNILTACINSDLRRDICTFTNEVLVDKIRVSVELEEQSELVREEISRLKRARGDLYNQYRDADGYKQREINDYIASQEADIYEATERLMELSRRHGRNERDIRNLVDQILQEADFKFEQIKRNNNPIIVFLLDIFKNPQLLYHTLTSEIENSLLYVYKGFSFVMPIDVRINLSYFDDPFGQVKEDYEYKKRYDDKNDNTSYNTNCIKPYGNSWFSPQAHKDKRKLKEEFIRLAKFYHPDVSHLSNSKEIFQEITKEREEIKKRIC